MRQPSRTASFDDRAPARISPPDVSAQLMLLAVERELRTEHGVVVGGQHHFFLHGAERQLGRHGAHATRARE
jgi:hypothetical protein